MHRLGSYLPQDRLRALAGNADLPTLANGSAIFADVSGFTPLTEKLTQSLGPRKGVEELSRVLNMVYNALIDQVENYGGSIISFAGDSVIGWFNEADGPSTPLRALTCAKAMQSAMRGFDGISLKVSITTGSARRFVVGDPNIQFLDAMAGRTIARLATGERLANSGEIILDEATCISLEDRIAVILERRDEATSEKYTVVDVLNITANPQPLSPLQDDAVTIDTLKPWILPTVYERESTGLITFLTELRPAVPAFVKFSGIDYDNDTDALEKLNAFVVHAQRVVTKYEGALLQLVIGDKGSYVYAVFGAPIAHEDDAQRAVYAALELKQTPQKLEFIKSIQVGVSLGTLRVGAYGSATRRTYAALGDDVNLAARLMTTAKPAEILITGRVQIDIADAFTLEPREPIAMKGKGEPQPVFAVTGISHHRATRLPEPTYRLPMIGRQEELSLVDEKLTLASQGKGQVIGITADAGMGKSRLVAEVIRLARKRGFVGYGGACQSSGTNTPYLVWKPIWQAFFDLDPEMPQRKQMRLLEGEIEDRVPDRVDALPLLGPVLDLALPDNDFTRTLDPKDRKSALEVLLEECLKSAVKDAPLLIVLEDLHWIDPLSHDLLKTLARVSENLSVCFVLAYRPPDQVRYQTPQVENLPYFTKIELRNLTSHDAKQLIRAKLAQLFPERTGSLPKALAEELTAKSQGNPFFIEELINFLHDRGLNPYDHRALDSLELPASLQTLILSRIDQLTEPQKVTLKVASVIGRVFPFSWLFGYYPSLGDESVVKENLAELSKLDLTPLDTPDPELAYLFKHIVTQEVAYETLSYATRAQLHELLARYLEAIHPNDPPLDALTYHYNRSENLPKKREYLRRSAEAAYAVYSNETALEFYKQALVLSPEQDELIDIHLKSGEILQMIGKRIEARSHYETALYISEKINSHERIVESQLKYADTSEGVEEALGWLNKALELARRTNNTKGVCDALKDLSNRHWRMGKHDLALQLARESLDVARQINDRKREAAGLFFIASILGERGQYQESHEYFRGSLEISKEINDTRRIGSTLLNWGTTYYYEGNYVTAEKYITESLAFYREIGDKRTIAISLNNLGNIFFLKNDYQTAEKHYTDSLALGRETDDRYIKSISLASLGITTFQQGKYEQADAHYEEGMINSRALNHAVMISLLHCYQGLLALVRGNVSSARDSFHAGVKLAHEGDIKAYVIYNLVGCANAHLAENKTLLAVKLLGSSTAIADAIGFKMEPEIKGPYERAIATAKEKLGEDEFSTAWDEGQKMTPDQAVELELKG
jgi:predicted ATPase/class 3 adenylate cyclase